MYISDYVIFVIKVLISFSNVIIIMCTNSQTMHNALCSG